MVLSRTQGPPPGVPEDQLATAYSLLLLSEYNHTLDSLPLDLSRNFADLRELDAVLSTSMTSITSKIHNLTGMIEEGAASKEDRLWLLTEISEEASRLKLGGEDKIRVACQAADNLKAHSNHLRNLAEHLPGFDTNVLNRKTTYPHVSAQSFMPVHTFEHGRRRRNALGSLLTATSNNADPSPAKRKRVNREDDVDVGGSKSPRKEKVETTGRGRVNNRVKKTTERAGSPTESVLSANAFPRQTSQNGKAAAGSSSRAGTSTAGAKRSRGGNTNRTQTPLANEISYDPRSTNNNVNYSVSANGSHRGLFGVANQESMVHMAGYANGIPGGVPGIMQAYDMHNISHLQNWNPANGQPLEGPGMPVSRGATAAAHVVTTAGTSTSITTDNGAVDGTDVDGDADDADARYCFCNGVSYGEMIACDDEGCEREWFHLACTGLTAPPSGKWFCDDCKLKRNAKRTGRGGKRRTGGRGGK